MSLGVGRTSGIATLAITAGIVFLACGSGNDSSTTPGADAIALGQSLYAANCATCHGAQGEGQPNWQSRRPDGTLPAPPHDASGHTWHHPDEVLIEIVTIGGQAAYDGPGLTSGMPAFGDQLTADEIAAVLAYIKSFWGEDERTYQSSIR